MVRTVINIVHLQPIVPHYREEFFSILGEKTNQTIYVYEDLSTAQSASFNLAHIHCRHIASKMLAGRILFYNPFKLLSISVNVKLHTFHFVVIVVYKVYSSKKNNSLGAGDIGKEVFAGGKEARLEIEVANSIG